MLRPRRINFKLINDLITKLLDHYQDKLHIIATIHVALKMTPKRYLLGEMHFIRHVVFSVLSNAPNTDRGVCDFKR